MNDHLIKATTKDGKFRIISIITTELSAQAALGHKASRIASVVLSRALTSSLLLGSATLKGEEMMHVRINGRGPIGNIVTEVDADGHVRGYVTNERQVDIFNVEGGLDIPSVVGTNGIMQITKVAPYSEPYTGQVEIATGEIGTDFMVYLTQSEQIPSAIGVSAYLNDKNIISAAGGFIIQALPGTSEIDFEQLEQSLENLKPLPTLLLEGHTAEDIAANIFDIDNLKILSKQPVNLMPEVSKEYFSQILETLDAQEIKEMIEEDHGAEVVNRFTGKKHYFTEEELSQILDKISKN